MSYNTIPPYIVRKRRVTFVRHGHRFDRYLACAYPSLRKDWVQNCFAKKSYQPCNVEMPLNLPKRTPISNFYDDTPLSTMGELCSQLLGNRFAEIGIDFDAIFSSPSLRCVQTASRILQGYEDYTGPSSLKIRIDTGLYEWGGIDTSPVTFLPTKFFSDRGCPVDVSYKCSMSEEELRHVLWESYEEFAQRGLEWMKKMFDGPCKRAESILFVSHATTVLSFVRELLGKPWGEELMGHCVNIPANLAVLMVEEVTPGKWWLSWPQPLPSFAVRGNSSFDQQWLNNIVFEPSVI